MMTNPYAGQPAYERAWSDGHEYGLRHPNEERPRPPGGFSPFELSDQELGWMQQVWLEGVLAGREASHQGVPVQVPPAEAPHQHSAAAVGAHVGVEVVEIGHTVYEVAVVGSVGVAGGIVSAIPGVLVLLISLESPPPADAEKAGVEAWFTSACQSFGANDFYLPLTYSGGSEAFWHGRLYYSYGEAQIEAEQRLREYPDQYVQIVHYSCTAPDVVESVELAVKS